MKTWSNIQIALSSSILDTMATWKNGPCLIFAFLNQLDSYIFNSRNDCIVWGEKFVFLYKKKKNKENPWHTSEAMMHIQTMI